MMALSIIAIVLLSIMSAIDMVGLGLDDDDRAVRYVISLLVKAFAIVTITLWL